jgi:uncharacterized membrane-anchored protein YitT (DUF2179 family)
MKLSKKIREKLSMNLKDKIIRISIQQFMIVIGSVIAASGYVLFQLPYNIAAGGITGLAIIIHKVTGFNTGYFILAANIPLFVLGYFYLGRWKFVWSSILAVVAFSLSTEFFVQYFPLWTDHFPVTKNVLLASIYAGVIYGIGIGIIYRFGGTTGGTSIPARIINRKTGFPLGESALFTDFAIIILAGFTFSMETALFAFITLVLVGIFSDYVLEGPSQTRTITVITSKPEPIREAIMYELRRGVSHWEIVGGYTGAPRTMLYLTVLRSRIYDVKFIISHLDPKAFVVVGVTQQVWGGFNPSKLK